MAVTWNGVDSKATIEAFAFPPMALVTDRVNRLFSVPTSGIMADLVYMPPRGRIDLEYQDFRDTYAEVYSADYIGEESLNVPRERFFEKYGRMFPYATVIGPNLWDTGRLLQKIERDNGLSLAEKAVQLGLAYDREVNRIINRNFREVLVTGKALDGKGGLSPISNAPFFSDNNAQLRKPGGPPFSNQGNVQVSSITAPTVADASALMKAAEASWLAADQSKDVYFVDIDQVRDGVVVLVTSDIWLRAFDDLRTLDTLAVNDADPASNASVYPNIYKGRFKLHYLATETGQAWENNVRLYRTGPEPEARPIRMQDDLGAFPYSLEGQRSVTTGITWSYYLDAWMPESGFYGTPVL